MEISSGSGLIGILTCVVAATLVFFLQRLVLKTEKTLEVVNDLRVDLRGLIASYDSIRNDHARLEKEIERIDQSIQALTLDMAQVKSKLAV